MERPGGITNREHIVDIASSASASTPGGLDQPASSSSSTAPEWSRRQALPSNASIANTPTVSGRSPNGTRRGRVSLSVSRLWFWLRQLIAAIQVIACSVSLALVQDPRDGNSPGISYRMLIVAYLIFRVVGLFLLCWSCCRHRLPNPFQIPDEDFSFASWCDRSMYCIMDIIGALLNVYFVLWTFTCINCVLSREEIYPDDSRIFYWLCFVPVSPFIALWRSVVPFLLPSMQ